MKRIFIRTLLILIILLPIINAQGEYSEYKDLDLNFYLGANLSVVRLKDDSNIDYASVSVLLLPKNDSRLRIKSLYPISEPEASVILGDKASFSWNKIETNSLKFGLMSKVNINNDIIKIRKKIKFPITSDENRDYTLPTKFIDLNSGIVEQAHKIVEGEDDLYFAVFKIAEWVRGNIRYDLNSLTEKVVQKSTWVFENKEGVCDEMTNLFISMLRTVGIPARFVSGTVYSNGINAWGNHGWAEVYFPDYGWVPFDVTFGQYGWVDPSHLKLSDTADSGESSVEYNWRARDVDLRIEPITISTNLDKIGTRFNPLFDIKINTLNDNKFNFGSYVPIEVSVTNLNNFYLSTVISLTKSPELLGKNFKGILLAPKETRNYYFIGKLQNNLSKSYEYSGLIEVQEAFGSNSFYTILLRENYNFLKLEEAKAIIDKLNKREEKNISALLKLNCKTDKNTYYSDEEIKIYCDVRNNGNTLLYDVNVCLKTKCYSNDLRIGEEKIINFKTINEKKITISAETRDIVTRNNLKVDIIEIPKLFISGINPSTVNYYDDVDLSFTLNSDVKIYNTSLLVNGDKFYDIKDINGDKEVHINIKGYDLIYGLNMRLWYNDKLGNRYTKDFNFNLKVEELPWYIRLMKVLTFSKQNV